MTKNEHSKVHKSRYPHDEVFLDGFVVERRCRICGLMRPIDEYKIKHDNPGARNRVCRSCLSARANKNYKNDPRYRAQLILANRKLAAKKLNLPFELDFEWLMSKIMVGKCEATGLPLEMVGQSNSAWSPSIDRIDPTLGYTLSNSRIVCIMYNLAKNDWSDSEVLIMARALIASEDAK
jgi:hypothetical protein